MLFSFRIIQYFLIVLIFLSCKNRNEKIAFTDEEMYMPEISTEKLDTAKIIPYTVAVKPEIFETAFFDSAAAKIDTFPTSFYAVNIGKIKITSGKIIAGDPIVMQDISPFLQTFPIGQFPVQLAIAEVNEDQRVAFSRILFSDSPVVKWEYALKAGQTQKPIDGEDFYGYGVDAGIGLFIDKEANDQFSLLRTVDEGIWNKVFWEDMHKNYRNSWDFILYNFGDHNLAAFSTGYGDGHYGTYVGYDSKGNVCRLLTDFGMIDWWHK